MCAMNQILINETFYLISGDTHTHTHTRNGYFKESRHAISTGVKNKTSNESYVVNILQECKCKSQCKFLKSSFIIIIIKTWQPT